MPTTFEESRLEFVFSDDWWVCKYDDSPHYRRHIGALPGTCAIDFVALRKGVVWLIEVKNFRKHTVEGRERLGGPLWVEVGHKVRDTIAGIVAAGRRGDERFRAITDRLSRPAGRQPGDNLQILAWIEREGDPAALRAEAVDHRAALDRQVRWLLPHHAHVAGRLYGDVLAPLGVEVKSLPDP